MDSGGGSSTTSMTSSSFAWLKWIGGSRPGSYLDTYLPYLYSTQYQSMLLAYAESYGFLGIAIVAPPPKFTIEFRHS